MRLLDKTIQLRVRNALKETLRPEFLNRIDETIIFHSLSESAIGRIIELKLADLNKRLAEQDIQISLTDAAKTIVAKEGFDPHYGARPLARALKRLVENPLARAIVSGDISDGDHVLVDSAAMSDALLIRKQTPEST